MTKRSGTHKLQRERRRRALAERINNPDHAAGQTWHGKMVGWVKWVTKEAA